MSQPPRVMLDTNLVLSALVFAKGRVSELRHTWQSGRFVPLVSKATATELIRVLAYPKFRLATDEQRELLADHLPWCETTRIPNPPPAAPACRDVFDLAFLQLAISGRADALVTLDQDLLSLAGQITCPIVTAKAFLKTLRR